MSEQIKAILDRWNPIGLDPLSPDEYLPAAEQIADSINEHFTVHSVCIVLRRSLKHLRREFLPDAQGLFKYRRRDFVLISGQIIYVGQQCLGAAALLFYAALFLIAGISVLL